MIDSKEVIIAQLDQALKSNRLHPNASETIIHWLETQTLPSWARESIFELVQKEQWESLSDRFYKDLAFGTGGLRSRTIDKYVTVNEKERAAVGSNRLNDFNVIKATMALYQYCCKFNSSPSLVIAYDVRHFSKHFATLAGSVWSSLGGVVYMFDGPRSTPALSFTIRNLKATAGVVITASHNPPHDNGYKVYFSDGAQIINPHAQSIIGNYNSINLADTLTFIDIKAQKIEYLNSSEDAQYLAAVKETVLNASLVREHSPTVLFSPIHGVGHVAVGPLLSELGVDAHYVSSQMQMDSGFSTVSSPNPENPEAFELAFESAKSLDPDAILLTDPDADRMGVAVKNAEGEYICLSGNLTAALLLDYRIQALKEKNRIPRKGSETVAVIKTFVTSKLIESIAQAHNIKCVNTLTGFKWIGSKLFDYEKQLLEEIPELDYDNTSLLERSSLLQKNSTYFIFGAEESYGYLASDRVRDKDANAAVVQFCELCAYLKSRKTTFSQHIIELYLRYGFYKEKLYTLTLEGPQGAQNIKNILNSLRKDPPKLIGHFDVESVEDFLNNELLDCDGKPIANENFIVMHLSDGFQVAVRPSGTEPKIKFYLFASSDVSSVDQLNTISSQVESTLQALSVSLEHLVSERAKVTVKI